MKELVSIISADPTGNVIEVNDAAETIFGYTREEILGKSVAMFHDPAEVESVLPELLAKAAGPSGYEGTLNFVRKDGSTFKGQIQVSTVKDAAGNIVKYSGATRVVSEE